MTLVRFNHRPASNNFNNLIDGFLPAIPSLFKEEARGYYNRPYIAANVKETEAAYVLELLAPGFEKADFNIQLEEQLLTISAEKKHETEVEKGKYLRKEHNLSSFRRTFAVTEDIDTDMINAAYVNGILTLNLPKKAEVKVSAKQIDIQ